MIVQEQLGASSSLVTLADEHIMGTANNPDTAEAGFRIGNDGKNYQRVLSGGSYTFLDNWLTPPTSGDASLYECMATIISGTLTTGTTGSWLALTSNRDWTKTTTIGSHTVSFTLDVRPVGGTIVDSATITLEVEVIP